MIKKYEKYKESGIEWLGEIPEHWGNTSIKNVLEIPITDGPHTTPELIDEGVPFISAEAIKNGKIDFDKRRGNISEQDYELFSKKYIPKVNDIYMVKSGATTGNVAKLDVDMKFTIWSPLAVFRANVNKVIPEFLHLYLQSSNLRNAVEVSWSYGTQQNIGMGVLSNLNISLPTLSEQTQIANFLDHQTTIIDDLIGQKEKLIALLKEKRQAIINEAVTKGLNPNAKMKDSGIEWLGEVPEHWKVARIGHYTQLVRGASPRPAGDSRYFGGEFMPWITVGEVTNGGDKYLLSTENFLTELGSQQSRIIYPETLLLSNSGATLGVPKISKITGCINDGSVAFLTFDKRLERDFLFYFFKTHTEIYRQEMSGYGQPNLNTDIVKSTQIPLPPIEEQIQIVKFIETEFDEFDFTIGQSILQITKLKDYRQSLISEAVTGKIDVREWVDIQT